MPEYPDVTVYVECLQRLVVGAPLKRMRVTNPFLLRTVDPPHDVVTGRRVEAVRRFGKSCPDCGSAVQRIRYAESECNYCAKCQTGGRLLADRSLSRLLKADWPKRIEDLEIGK